MDAIDEQSGVMALEGLGELVEELDELLGGVTGQFQRQADDRQVIRLHGYWLAARGFLAVERAAARFAARSFASFRR